MVYVADVMHGKDVCLGHVAEGRDLGLGAGVYFTCGSTDDQIRRETEGSKLLHAVLRGLGLLLAAASGSHHRQQRDMHEHRIFSVIVPEGREDHHSSFIIHHSIRVFLDTYLPTANWNCRNASRNTMDSMSPTVPPTCEDVDKDKDKGGRVG